MKVEAGGKRSPGHHKVTRASASFSGFLATIMNSRVVKGVLQWIIASYCSY